MTAFLPPPRTWLTDEGLRLFFPAAAIHGALWPLIWVALYDFSLPLARSIPASQWHAHEMIFGTYGMALAGFLTSAVPEWTGTQRWRGRALLALLLLWLPGRLAGLLGADILVLPTAITDALFLSGLFWAVLSPMLTKRSTRHASFAVWALLFLCCEIAIRIAWLAGDFTLSARLLHAGLAIFLVFFALSVARINVVVINLALDPSGETTPYRPHPGRQNLAAGLVALYVAALLALPASLASAYLALAAAAAFFDRLAEWFIGQAVLRAEVLALGAANAMAGIGFAVIGLSGLGFPVLESTGLHLLSMGSLGMAVVSVFVIAGLRHTGRPLLLPLQAHVALGLMLAAALMRTLPELGIFESLLGVHYALAAILWAAAFAAWLHGFLPFMRAPGLGEDAEDAGCGGAPT